MITIPQFLDFPLNDNSKEIVTFFLKLLEQKNKLLFLHSQQVANYSVSIAAKMCLPLPDVATIKTAALLHDIGHLATPNALMAKYPFFNTREMAAFRRHSVAGCSMLENIPELDHVLDIILHHHETWDGKGFPNRLKGVNIPLGARIVAVADYYDVFINPCAQNWKKSHEEAATELRKYAGTRFDPEVVKAFFSILTNSKDNSPRKLAGSKDNMLKDKKARSS